MLLKSKKIHKISFFCEVKKKLINFLKNEQSKKIFSEKKNFFLAVFKPILKTIYKNISKTVSKTMSKTDS